MYHIDSHFWCDFRHFFPFTNDAIVFGILMISLGFVFFTESKTTGFWHKFYKIVPGLLMCYFIPAIFSSLGIISSEKYLIINSLGFLSLEESQTYYIASRYLLPASLVLMTLSIDLKAIYNLGYKALVMFFTGTIGIIIGGPLAILILSFFFPELFNGAGPDAIWRGLSTLAGSWIGGGANQAAMLEIFDYNLEEYPKMVLVDIFVANIWMAVILLGIGKKDLINKWLKADTTAIEELKEKVMLIANNSKRIPTLTDYMVLLSVAFGTVGLSHLGAEIISDYLIANFESVADESSGLSSFGSKFFWMITIATFVGIGLSFTKARNYEAIGASKIGTVFIYILVATIGMKMDLGSIWNDWEELGVLMLIGVIWMAIHASLLIVTAKIIRAPYFFLAVGSQANVGGAASAPVVAAAFHPSLATVGVLLAVFGYVVGTYGAMICTYLMEYTSNL